MLTIDVAAEPKNITPMSPDEARASIERINEGVNSIRVELLELHRRQGWKALGYGSWKEFTDTEFAYNHSRLYQLLDAAEVEVNLVSAGVEASKILEAPESHIRVIKKAPVTRQAAAFEQLKTWEKEDGKVTEREAEAAVAAVDPNFAHQKATQIATKHIASGADIDPDNLDEVFKDASPRLRQVLAEPVRQLLEQGVLKLPQKAITSTRSVQQNTAEGDEDDSETEEVKITEKEAEEVRLYLLDFNAEEVAIIVLGLPPKYVEVIRRKVQ